MEYPQQPGAPEKINIQQLGYMGAMCLVMAGIIGVFFVNPVKSKVDKELAKVQASIKPAQAASGQVGALKKNIQDLEAEVKSLQTGVEEIAKKLESLEAQAPRMAALEAQVEANKNTVQDTVNWTQSQVMALQSAQASGALRTLPAPAAGGGSVLNTPGAPRPVSVPAPASTQRNWDSAQNSGEPIAQFEDDYFRYEIFRAWQEGENLTILGKVTALKKDENFEIGYDTRIFAKSGEEYKIKKAKSGSTTVNSQGRKSLSKRIIHEVKTPFELHFEVSERLSEIPALYLKTEHFGWRDFPIRDIPVSR